jgi:hypothetical protein
LELQYLVSSETVGFNINNSDTWNRGHYINQKIEKDIINSSVYNLVLEDPVSVGDLYYIYQNGINQNDPQGIALTGFRGFKFKNLLSPVQALSIVNNTYKPGFDTPYSVYRLINRNFLICDTLNDRVIETTYDGQLVRGLGGHNVDDLSAFYPLCGLSLILAGVYLLFVLVK